MTYYTEAELRGRSGLTASGASRALKEAARTATGTFDIFLSHSITDAEVILGLKELLEGRGMSVYVDWVEDPELDRGMVSPRTAARLRERMRSSRSMVYATSRAASRSRWMPWELGYFDGAKGPDRISICPIESTSTHSFVGQEYLGLYKVFEKVRLDGVLQPSVVRRSMAGASAREAEKVASFVLGADRWVPVA